MDELEKLLADDKEKETPPPALENPPKEETPEEKIDKEVLAKKEQLDNVTKAILEANNELKRLRKEKKGLKPEEEEELPKINMEDPSAKAWDKHIGDKVNPIQTELDKEKEEIRTFALQEFLADKPSLSKNPEKLKELMATYEKIRTATERTKEGVMLDLKKSYAAIYHEELLDAARNRDVAEAKANEMFSDIAVSKGSTSYSTEKKVRPKLSEDDKLVLAKWGMTEDEWQKMKEEKKE